MSLSRYAHGRMQSMRIQAVAKLANLLRRTAHGPSFSVLPFVFRSAKQPLSLLRRQFSRTDDLCRLGPPLRRHVQQGLSLLQSQAMTRDGVLCRLIQIEHSQPTPNLPFRQAAFFRDIRPVEQQRFFQKRRVLPGEMLLQKARNCIRLFTRKLHRVDFAQAEHSACRQPPRPAHQHIAPVLLIFLHDDGLKQTMPGDRLRQHWQRGILPKTRRNHAAVDFIHWQAHCPQCFFLRTNSLSALQKPFPLDVLCQGVYAVCFPFDDGVFK